MAWETYQGVNFSHGVTRDPLKTPPSIHSTTTPLEKKERMTYSVPCRSRMSKVSRKSSQWAKMRDSREAMEDWMAGMLRGSGGDSMVVMRVGGRNGET